MGESIKTQLKSSQFWLKQKKSQLIQGQTVQNKWDTRSFLLFAERASVDLKGNG